MYLAGQIKKNEVQFLPKLKPARITKTALLKNYLLRYVLQNNKKNQ